MEANVGDHLVVRSRHVGEPDREALILEAHGQRGGGPYRVRWSDGHESVFFPSSDCTVTQPGHGTSP
jgi:hypothetical protein